MLGGPGADFLRGVAFWSIRSSVLGRWFCVTGAARASKAMSWTTSDNFVLERKKCFFRRNPRRTKLLFRAGKNTDFPLLKWPFQGIRTRNLFQKYKKLYITTVSNTPLIVLALCDVITDTASCRCCYLFFEHFWLGNVLRATMACTFSTCQLPKVVRHWGLLCILTWKCASRHNGVHFFDISTSKSGLCIVTSICASRHNGLHFFDISTSKSGPSIVCFVHFDFHVCFAPQPRALFRHVNFQKWSDTEVFYAFWLGNVLHATMACTFSKSQLPKAVRALCVLRILTSIRASRHNGVQLFISYVTTWLRTRRFSEPIFRIFSTLWSHKSLEKNKVFRDFPTFLRTWIFFLLRLSFFWSSFFFSSLTLPISAFHLSILSEVWLLNILRLYLCNVLSCHVL